MIYFHGIVLSIITIENAAHYSRMAKYTHSLTNVSSSHQMYRELRKGDTCKFGQLCPLLVE